jgi:broad specificity phosphatase PhoE
MQKIILLRHGAVDIENYKNISANQFGKWITEYNNSDIKAEFPSKNEIKNLLNKTDILVCSNLKRSIQSIEIFDKIPFETNDIFNEAQLPFSNGNLLKLNPKIWLIIFRLLWFFGYSQNSESFKEAKQRAKSATEKLVELSKQNKTIILVGHGIINKLIQKELILQQWVESKKLQSKNWCYGVFELQT